MNPGDRPRVVYDCMVFVQGAARVMSASAACLERVTDNRVELLLSEAVIAEIKEVMVRPALRERFSALTPPYVAEFLEPLVARATLIREPGSCFRFQRHPKDQPYLDLACTGAARYLVSRDRDLLDLMTAASPDRTLFLERCPDIVILDPGAFLRRLP